MGQLAAFGGRLRVRGRRVQVGAARILREATLAGLVQLVRETPIDTGRAKSNWQVGVGSPTGGAPTSVLPEAYVPGKRGNTRAQNEAAAISAAYAAAAGSKDGQSLYIANNLPYIDDLNAGSSRQAPAGFVQRAIGAIRANIRTNRLRL